MELNSTPSAAIVPATNASSGVNSIEMPVATAATTAATNTRLFRTNPASRPLNSGCSRTLA